MGINSQPNIVNNHRDLPNHTLANINQIKAMNQYNLKKLKNPSASIQKNVSNLFAAWVVDKLLVTRMQRLSCIHWI